MILGEPPRTNYDLHFVVAGVPVRVHPMFWLVSLVLGISDQNTAPVNVIIWMVAMFVSIMVHEMGHALAIRHYGWTPRIVLHSLGGLAIYDTSESYSYHYNANEENPRVKIRIAAAGPAAGFVLAGAIIGLLWLTGHPVRFEFGGSLGFSWVVENLPNPKAAAFVYSLIFINIFWGLMNLLPVYPLDGGQISREVFVSLNPYDGVLKSLWLSAIAGGAVAVFALVWFTSRDQFKDGLFIGLMFGFLAYASYATLQAFRGGGYGGFGGPSEDRGW